jgi:hypothetical protein
MSKYKLGDDQLNIKAVFKWEVFGFFFILLIGSLLHFCFEWSGRCVPLALFCAVNESVWEHLKLGFWPGLFFALLEYVLWGKRGANFLVAKTLSLYIMPILTIILFYSYTAILGTHVLWIDLSIFVVSVLLAQYISFQVIISEKNYSSLNKAAFIMLTVLTLAFSLFTYFPPKLELFIDPRTGKPGISAT